MAFIDIDGLDVWSNPRTWESTTVSEPADSISVAPDGSWSREVNKDTHEIRFENQSESSVTIVVRPKGEKV